MLSKYYDFKPFSDTEAWTLFRVAAIGEAVGWTILITGLILGHYLRNSLPVLIAGQFHGILFLIYLTTSALLSPSMSWRPKKILTAIGCGVPPYGSLIFELWQTRAMNHQKIRGALHKLYLSQLAALD